MSSAEATPQRRNKAFEETHQEMIETAVRLISETGVEALSVSALARAMNVNRTTVYYHFESRDVLIAAVKAWSSAQLARAFQPIGSQAERIDYISRFVLENPELIKLWIEDFVSPGDIHESYPHWDGLVKGVQGNLAEAHGDAPFDAEIFCVILITSAIIGPRVFKNRVRPQEATERVIERFRTEWQRMLRTDGMLKP
ncbi:TetR/AcrR family transcriptional regulator [Phenylobacterium sp. LjRoot225]|uniref:TetR/AcrR family transcriptional regulator n=1 Tax=Phenylobacterium sp. LjRoot225 TaxID=3342285 RepID=UPI003ECE0BDE